MKLKTRDLVIVAMCVALIAIGAMIKIPSPVAGYFTLQLPFVVLIGVILGSKRASIAAFVYMAGGLIGIPWFAAGGGLMYIIKPTFGFIMSFIVAALISGATTRVNKQWKIYGLAFLATIFVWVYGMIHYTFVLKVTSGTDLTYFAAIIGILSPDFYTDIILTLVFTKVGTRIRKSVEV